MKVTEDELKVIKLRCVKGYANEETAKILHVKDRTVSNRIRNAAQKLGIWREDQTANAQGNINRLCFEIGRAMGKSEALKEITDDGNG
jgi:DNA-binding NarL/FixJ family response regulator